MSQKQAATVWLGEETISEIDKRRPSTMSRSEWVRKACQDRLDAGADVEDPGES